MALLRWIRQRGFSSTTSVVSLSTNLVWLHTVSWMYNNEGELEKNLHQELGPRILFPSNFLLVKVFIGTEEK